MSNIAGLKIKMIKLYFNYKNGLLSLEDYIQQIKPLDIQIDQLEIQTINCYLLDNRVSEISSSKHLH